MKFIVEATSRFSTIRIKDSMRPGNTIHQPAMTTSGVAINGDESDHELLRHYSDHRRLDGVLVRLGRAVLVARVPRQSRAPSDSPTLSPALDRPTGVGVGWLQDDRTTLAIRSVYGSSSRVSCLEREIV